MNRLPFACVALAIACTCTPGIHSVFAAEEPPALAVKVEREQDQAVVKMEGETALITITSPSGIGRAEITPAKEWPKTLMFRLELKALEGFRARAGDTEVAGSLGGKTVELMKYGDGRGKSIPNENGRWELGISRQKRWIRVELPTEPFRQEKSIRVQWIDYYR